MLETLNKIIVIAVAIVGGLWALRRYRIERRDQSALEIDLRHRSVACGTGHVVYFDVVLTNRGKVMIQAKHRSVAGITFDDGGEHLAYAGSLQLKLCDGWTPAMNRDINWFEGPGLQHVQGLGEINLLTEYENPKLNNQVDFWMEPGEIYHLGAIVMLDPGVYLAKVTFVGNRDDDDFWSRVSCVEVPAPETPRAVSTSGSGT